MSGKQNGNILFLILLAVVLFAALSYAVTSSMRGGGKDGGTEKNRSVASQIIQYGGLLENTVTRMRLSNNCSDMDISFINSVTTIYNSHISAPACQIFNPSGGGMVFQTFKIGSTLYNPQFSGSNYVQNIGTTCTDGTCNDLVMILAIPNNSLCMEINNIIGIPNPNNTSPVDTDVNTGTAFIGAYSTTPAQILDQTGGVLNFKNAGCLYESGSSTYVYYNVLLAR